MNNNIPLRITDLLIHKLELKGKLILEDEYNENGWTILASYFTSQDIDDEGTVITHKPGMELEGRAIFNYSNNYDQNGGEFSIDVYCHWQVKNNKIFADITDIKISTELIKFVDEFDIEINGTTKVDSTESWKPVICRSEPDYRPEKSVRPALSPEHLLNIQRKKMREWNELAAAPGSLLQFQDTSELDAQWTEIKRQKRLSEECSWLK